MPYLDVTNGEPVSGERADPASPAVISYTVRKFLPRRWHVYWHPADAWRQTSAKPVYIGDVYQSTNPRRPWQLDDGKTFERRAEAVFILYRRHVTQKGATR
jgi:hypothetical protein